MRKRALSNPRGAKRFSASHAATSKFVKRGLRGYFEYRDLAIKSATRGKVIAHVIRARPGKSPHGSCFYQPPRIRHRELAHSRNVEMIEVVSPANFRTYAA